ncbi:hypothetical protein AX16_003069 [Volvariella volvacea WC 439]|nr:hypothetical protein AX16_003069 [Volvariella volvacea WC 439]
MRSRLSPALSPLQLPLCQPFSDATNPDVDEVEVAPIASMIGLQAEEQAPLDSTVEIDTLAASNYEGLRPSTEMAVSSITEGASSDPIILDDAGSDTEAISPSTSGDTNAITDPPRTADEAHSDNDAIVGEMVYNLTSTQKILQVTLRNPADEHSVLPPTLTIDLSKDQSPSNTELNRNLFQTLSSSVVMEKLTLKAPSDSNLDGEIDQAIFVSSLQVLSELKELEWDGGVELFPKEWMDGNVPWTNLTSLSLSLPLSDMQCLRIIDACSHLKDLHLDVSSRSPSEAEFVKRGTMVHPTLARIKIISFTNVNGLLGSLDPENGAEWHLDLRNSAIKGLGRLDTNADAGRQPCAFLKFTPTSKQSQRLQTRWKKLVIISSTYQS